VYATHSTLKLVPTLPRQRQIAVTAWQIPDAVDTVVCGPDDRRKYHPKHVEQFPDINKLCKVASCWIYLPINVKSPNNISKWQMEFNSAFKGLMRGKCRMLATWDVHICFCCNWNGGSFFLHLQMQQDRQSACNITLRCVHAMIVTVEKQWVFVALYCHIVICGLPRCTALFQVFSWMAQFSKNNYWTQSVCFDFLCNFCLKHF
jgi:hypothetical protein